MSKRLSLVLGLALLLAQVVGYARTTTARAAQEGVEGNTYTSPTFGWSISWDDNWEVTEEDSEDGQDYLAIADSLSTVYFESYEAFEGDALECVEEERDDLLGTDGVTSVEIGENARGEPILEGDEAAAYAVYVIEFTSAEDVEIEAVEYNDCRTLVEGEAVLEISHVVQREAYNDAAPFVQELLANLSMPGEEPVEDPDQDSGDQDGGEDENPELTESEVKSVAEQAFEDVLVFWTEVFDDHGIFPIDPLFEVIEDESEAPCSEGAVHPGVGSFYCGLNQTIYFDLSTETRDAQVGGIASPIYTVGHEAGHHVQMTLGIMFSNETLSVEMELEADCMAGAFMAWEIEQGAMTEEDFFINLDLVNALGDPEGTPVDHPQAHGMGSQRVSMVLRGYYNGIDACGTFPSDD